MVRNSKFTDCLVIEGFQRELKTNWRGLFYREPLSMIRVLM